MRKGSYVTVLDCRHVLSYNAGEPMPGDIVYCCRCTRYRSVQFVNDQIGARCDDCQYSRHFIKASEAERAAAEHVMKKVGHIVKLTGPDFVRNIGHADEVLFQ